MYRPIDMSSLGRYALYRPLDKQFLGRYMMYRPIDMSYLGRYTAYRPVPSKKNMVFCLFLTLNSVFMALEGADATAGTAGLGTSKTG
jgi:hypothetical protein